jgi:hypothetical protein
VRSRWTTTAASLLGLGLLLTGGPARAQQAPRALGLPPVPAPVAGPAEPSQEGLILRFSREPQQPAARAPEQPWSPPPLQAPLVAPVSAPAVPAPPAPLPLPIAVTAPLHQPPPPPAAIAPRVAPPVQRVSAQLPKEPLKVQAKGPGPGGPDDATIYNIPLEPPGPERLFRLESQAALFERMRQEARTRPSPDPLVFPEEPIVSKDRFALRSWAPLAEVVEPNYVCYTRLLFEQKNFERYGWDLGVVTPLVSAGAFFKDLALLPYHLGARPCEPCDCSTGYCLPGDPVPLLLYPPVLSVTGLAAEGAVITALFFFFP